MLSVGGLNSFKVRWSAVTTSWAKKSTISSPTCSQLCHNPTPCNSAKQKKYEFLRKFNRDLSLSKLFNSTICNLYKTRSIVSLKLTLQTINSSLIQLSITIYKTSKSWMGSKCRWPSLTSLTLACARSLKKVVILWREPCQCCSICRLATWCRSSCVSAIRKNLLR